jgi:hypothetical protein
VGVERGKTAVGFGACNEKTNYPYFGRSETPPCTLRSRLESNEGDYH